ncbi:DUF3052 domain-containing protein [Algoriphagus sp. SE2]|uniref:DUF3052 domain-containing protein n=1 Tax=Algoriphagus sp. SE2 TaxID=3141536 RepID=UPI0031CD9C73
MEAAEYSGTSLVKKLGIKSGMLVQVLFSPKPYISFFGAIRPDVNLETKPEYSEQADLIHLFVQSEEELEVGFKHAHRFHNKSGAFWVSWPKKTSGIPTEVDKYQIMSYGLESRLVDVKVAAIDESWSGLKFMYRIKDR